MRWEVVAIVGGVGLGVAYRVLHRWGRRVLDRPAKKLLTRGRACPVCGEPAVVASGGVLATKRDESGHWIPQHEMKFRCGACSADLCALNNGPLVTREAWDAGAREEFPRATVVE